MPRLMLSFKGKVLKAFPVAEGEMLVGSDPSCAVHIDSLAVQPRHASIVTRAEQCVLRDLGSPDGTFINNQRIQEHALKNGDLIRIGKHTIAFHQETVANASANDAAENQEEASEHLSLKPTKQAPSAWLQIVSGQNLGKAISLHRNLTNLGTPGVQTAVIAKRNDGYFLSHLEGEHPPLVDGVSIGDKAWPLGEGDIIQIGNVKMQFSLQ